MGYRPEKSDRIYLAGHRGLVGSGIARLLKQEEYPNVITRTHAELNLVDQCAVQEFFRNERIDVVILSAARVGGIQANIDHPAEFLYENLMIQNNVLEAARQNGVKKLVLLGSSCIYPRECPQPMREEYLLTGPLEPTNEGYALAKVAGLKLCEFYKRQYGFESVCPMPCNIYGPGDSFDLQHSHVLSALVKRFTDATDDGMESVTLWGSGVARREFMHVDDLAKAVLFLLNHHHEPDIVNVGWGTDVSIKELAELIAGLTGFQGRLEWDTSKPDGMPRKCLDTSKLDAMGFRPEISLEQGVKEVIAEYKKLKNA